MGTLSHLKSISASSYDNRSSIRLEFEFATDMDLMAVHIRDRLDQVRGDLPDDVEQVRIRRWNTEDFPILSYAVTWSGPDDGDLGQVFDHLILPRLQRLDGVGSVELRGPGGEGAPGGGGSAAAEHPQPGHPIPQPGDRLEQREHIGRIRGKKRISVSRSERSVSSSACRRSVRCRSGTI